MPTTSNFGWTTPADTDLVKDGAAAIRTLGNGVDASFLDLKGGTTDQVLAKNSNTDLDFKWVAADDADAIQKSLIDAEGDLIVGDAADAVQRLAIGSNGNVLTVDTSVDGKIKWAAPAAGGMTLLGSGTLSGSTVTLSSIPATYIDLVIYINSIVQDTSPEFVTLRLNNSTANTAVTTIYSTSLGHNSPSGPVYVGSGDSSYRLNTTGANAFAIRITNYAAAKRKAIQGFGSYKYSTDVNQIGWHLYGGSTDEVAYDRVDIVTAAGSFTAGNYAIYGVK